MKEKMIHLAALDLDVSVPECIEFYDDGVVRDIRAHLSFLNCKYTGKFLGDEVVMEKGTNGLTAGYSNSNNDAKKIHIFYLKSKYELKVRGHEEAHFLDVVERLKNLSDLIRMRVGVELDFDKIRGQISDLDTRRETIAEIGGIFAHHQREGWQSVVNFFSGNNPRSSQYNGAYNLYSTAREKSFKKAREASKPKRVFYL
jgi:hypothetical protein